MTAIPKVRLLRVYPPTEKHEARGIRYEIDGVDTMTRPGDVLAFDPATGKAATDKTTKPARYRVLPDGCLHPLADGE